MTYAEQRIVGLLESILEELKKMNEQPQSYIYTTSGNDDPIGVVCNCDLHKTGESTGGWYCPKHGQCF